MNHEQAQANLQLVLDWIDALRRRDIDAVADRFHPDVAWKDVAGTVACLGREQVLAWLRAAPAQPPQVDALEPQPHAPGARRSPAGRAAVHGLHAARRSDRVPARPRPPRPRARRGRAQRLPLAVAITCYS